MFLGCGGGEDILNPNPPVPPPPLGTSLTEEQRMTVLNECSTFVNAIGDIRSDPAQQVIAAFLKSRPGFKDAGIHSGNVWATFYDNRMAIIVPDYLTDPTFNENDPGGRVDYSAGRGRVVDPGTTEHRDNYTQRAIDARSHAIPLSKKGILFNGLGTAFLDGRVYLRALFNKSGTDCTLEDKPATIANLKAVSDQALVYMLSHGGVGFTFTGLVPTPRYSLWTSDLVTKEMDELFKTDFDAGLLSYVLGLQDLDQPYEWHYGITQEFVKKYMSFADDAIIYLDACSSMSDEAKPFGEQVLDKCANAKGTFVGWTEPMSAITYIPTHRYIFDRMIGSDDASPTQQDPPQRPFDFVSVYDDMLTYPDVFDLGVSKAYGGRLAYISRSDSEVLLTPSISYIIMSDYENLMAIHGLFGDGPPDKGNVWVNGSAARIISWNRGLIICEIDEDGPGSSGDVIVGYNGHHSNQVPLTAWTIPMTVTRDVGGIKTEAKLTLRLRADVHRYRTIPNADPVSERPDSLGITDLQGTFGWPFSKASSGRYTVGGSRSGSCAVGGCQVSELQSSTSGGQLNYNPVASGLEFSAFYRWSRDLKKLRVGLVVSIPDVMLNYTIKYRSCQAITPKDQDYSAPEHIAITVPSLDHDIIEFELDEKFRIVEGNKPKTHNFSWGLCDTPISMTTTVQWPTVQPEHAPTDETAARVGM